MVFTFLDRFQNFGLLLLRLGYGVMYVLHGYPKLEGGRAVWESLGQAMSHLNITAFPEVWGFMASVSEFAGGIMLALGFLFRPACVLMAATMGVAATMHIANNDPFSAISHPIENGIVLLSLIFIGPGRYAVDSLVRSARARKAEKKGAGK